MNWRSVCLSFVYVYEQQLAISNFQSTAEIGLHFWYTNPVATCIYLENEYLENSACK